MDPMPRRRLPYLVREIARGKIFWYFRRGRGKRTRIRGDYGSREFMRTYEAALSGTPLPADSQDPAGTLSWLISRYQDSVTWEKLSKATKSQRSNIYKAAIRKAGDGPVSAIDRASMQASMVSRADRPFAANDFLKAMRGLFRWAHKSGLVASDPTEGVEGYPEKTEGFRPWAQLEIEAFERRWPIGTRERLALALLLYTGLRRGDVVRLGRQHIREGIIHLRTEKTGIEVMIPILPELAAVINSSPTSDLAFICGQNGRPMCKESFGNWFRDVCRSAGVPGRAHGLRKAGAERAAENGATVAELEAIFGWIGGRMASYYTRSADRGRLAKRAMEKLRR